MSVTGEPDGSPVRCGISVVDLSMAMLSAMGVLSALYHRSQTGLGQRVDGNMILTALTLLNYQAEGYLSAGLVPKAFGSGTTVSCPYRNFRCADGQWVFVAAANENAWKRFAPAVGLEKLVDDPRYATNRERVRNRMELERIVQESVGRYNREDLLQLLRKAGVPATPVNRVDQFLEDPQIVAQNMIWRMEDSKEGGIPVPAFPLSFSRIQPRVYRTPPKHGEHTDEVLREFGYGRNEVDRLRKGKVIL
jgi:formyl-CoA transferase/CoA:oxalate CoA-transferase